MRSPGVSWLAEAGCPGVSWLAEAGQEGGWGCALEPGPGTGGRQGGRPEVEDLQARRALNNAAPVWMRS